MGKLEDPVRGSILPLSTYRWLGVEKWTRMGDTLGRKAFRQPYPRGGFPVPMVTS